MYSIFLAFSPQNPCKFYLSHLPILPAAPTFSAGNFFRATRRNWSVARTQDTVVWLPTTGRCPPGPAQIWWCWVCQGFVGKHCLSPMETYISFSFRGYKCYYKVLTNCHTFRAYDLHFSWFWIPKFFSEADDWSIVKEMLRNEFIQFKIGSCCIFSGIYIIQISHRFLFLHRKYWFI